MFHNVSVRYLHFTDLHLSRHEGWGIFLEAVRCAAELHPHLVVITGDITGDTRDSAECREVYRRAAATLHENFREVLVVPGNHDDRTLFHEAFGRRYQLTEGWPRVDRVVDLAGQGMVLLDTADGFLHSDTIAWFDALLASRATGVSRGGVSRDVLVWAHHPVCTGFSTYMDAHHALQGRHELLEVIRRYHRHCRVHLFCGHYHTTHVVTQGNLFQYCTPSVAFQVDATSRDLRILDADRGSFRLVDHTDDGVRTTVVSRDSPR